MIWYLMLNVLYTCREQPQKRNLPNHYLQVAHPFTSRKSEPERGEPEKAGYQCAVACGSGTCVTTLAASMPERMQSGTPIP